MEFKGKQRAEEYVNNEFFNSGENKNIDQCFKNFAKDGFLDGYNQALEDSKAPALLDFINRISGEMLRNDFALDEKWYDQAQELIKQVTEL